MISGYLTCTFVEDEHVRTVISQGMKWRWRICAYLDCGLLGVPELPLVAVSIR
jgi:hypothetical protein